MSAPTACEVEAAAHYGMTVEDYVRKMRDCYECCHPETCNHPWAN